MRRSAWAAARRIEVPSGTVTGRPSIRSVTLRADSTRGVPRSRWSMECMSRLSPSPDPALPLQEVLPEMLERAADRVRYQSPQPAERSFPHDIAKLLEEGEVLLALGPRQDAVEDLDAAGRPDAAGGALPARLDRAELHGVARHAGHVDGVVEHH